MSKISKLRIKPHSDDYMIVSNFPDEISLLLPKKTAQEIFRRWNCHDDLTATCEVGVAPNVIQEYEQWITDRMKAPNLAVYRIQFEGLLRLLRRMLEQSEKSLTALAKIKEQS